MEKWGYETIVVEIHNGYPRYRVHCIFVVRNIGTIPVTIKGYTATDPDGMLTWDPDLSALVDYESNPVIHIENTDFVGAQIDPCNTEKAEFDFHIAGDAEECHTYCFEIAIVYTQWEQTTASAQQTLEVGEGKPYATLTPRSQIFIESDDFFTPDNGVNGGGSGTPADPYIIENWVIDASGAHGIRIENTTKYFVIRNCLVENGGSSYYGIYLENVINGKIENNTCRSTSHYGILLYYSSDVNLTNNTCESNSYGISLSSSDNCTIENNTCGSNNRGIYL
ncbi:unnamed protein product, partial [marine sediment metagenome]